MDKLKELLMIDPCYEQHIVSIKELYEQYLFSILIPAIYEGFQTTYNKSYEFEQKTINAAKQNPHIANCGILVFFQKCIKDIPNLSVHRIRTETERIKTSTKTSDILDDLIKAVCKSNIILLTYNVDHKRNELLQTKYHENIIIHDFIHNCYIHSAKIFYNNCELFYHINEPQVINQNKRTCYKIITKAIKESIRIMLPMKEILLEYTRQPYKQKEPINIQSNSSEHHITEHQTTEHHITEQIDHNSEPNTLLISEKPKNTPDIVEMPVKTNKLKVVNINRATSGYAKTFLDDIRPLIKDKLQEEVVINRMDAKQDDNASIMEDLLKI